MQRTTCAFSLFFQRREGRHLDDGGRGVRRGDDGRREGRLRDGGGRGVRCGDDGRREGRRRDCGGRGVRCGDDGRREGRRSGRPPRQRRAPRGTVPRQRRSGRPPRQRRAPRGTPPRRGPGRARRGRGGGGCDQRGGENRSLDFGFEGVSFRDYWWGILQLGVGIIHVEVSAGRRSHLVIRIVILTYFNNSSRIKSATELYSVVRDMFTSRSTRSLQE